MLSKRGMDFVLFTVAGFFCFAAQSPANGGPQMNGSQPQPNQQKPMIQQRIDCSQLTLEEQDFATQLSLPQKMVFCNKFDTAMRTSAMETSGQMGDDGVLMTNDQAVEKVAKENNIMMPMGPRSQGRKGPSCPSK